MHTIRLEARSFFAKDIIATLLTSLLMGTGPLVLPGAAMAWTGQPLAYVGTSNNTVTVIDTGDNKVVDKVPVSISPSFIAVTPDAKHAYVAGGDSLDQNGGVAVIETLNQTDTVVTTIPVQYVPQGIVASPDGARVYVVSAIGDSTDILVSVIDTATNSIVATIDIGVLLPSGIAISPDGTKLYVAIAGGLLPYGGLAVIDTTTNSVVKFIVVDTVVPNNRFFSAAVSPDNTKVYANTESYSYGDVIAIIDPSTFRLVTTIPDVMAVGTFSPDAKHLYGGGSGGVVVLDTTTNAVVTTIPIARGRLAITPDGKHLYVTEGSSNSVAVIDTSINTVSATVSGVSGAGAIAIVPAPSIVPRLHGFKVSKLDINVDKGRFELESELLLDGSSSGLDPENHPVRLQVGPFITTIPAGSFTKRRHDDDFDGVSRHNDDGFEAARRHAYGFEGVINDVHVSVTIKQTGTLRYAFDATARGASLAGVTNPVQVSLNINTQGGGLADVRAFIEPARHDWDD
jgi:YVTN family beta-propeller protein